MPDWEAERDPDEVSRTIERLATEVAKRGLFVPAILFLEMHRPLAFLSSQALLLGSGFLGPIFGVGNLQRVYRLLQSSENVERLIQRIEELSVLGHPAPTSRR